jgi:hypothetical protein
MNKPYSIASINFPENLEIPNRLRKLMIEVIAIAHKTCLPSDESYKILTGYSQSKQWKTEAHLVNNNNNPYVALYVYKLSSKLDDPAEYLIIQSLRRIDG